MIRRLVSAAALVACAGIYAFAATERATFILTDGERKSGTVVFHGDQHENLINGYLNLGVDNGKDMTFPIGQVAVIDFVGGQPATAELAQLGTGHMLVLRNGATQQGRLVNMTGGDTLFWENQSGQRQQYAIGDVGRVYLNPQSARTAFNYTQAPAPVATTGGRGGGAAAGAPETGAAASLTVRIDPRRGWTDTGLAVTRGDRVTFEAASQAQSGASNRPGNTPDRYARRRNTTGNSSSGLVGQIGNGAPFTIGMEGQPIVMPDTGRLMLSVDGNTNGNTNDLLTVIVTKQSDGRQNQQGGRTSRPR